MQLPRLWEPDIHTFFTLVLHKSVILWARRRGSDTLYLRQCWPGSLTHIYVTNPKAWSYYRQWPRYGLRCRGLCCHSGTARVEPAVEKPLAVTAAGPTRAVPMWDHKPRQRRSYSADRMSEQFIFYRGNEAIYCAKCSDDEPPCWNVSEWQRQRDESVHRNSVKIFGQHDVKIASGSCIDNVTITH